MKTSESSSWFQIFEVFVLGFPSSSSSFFCASSSSFDLLVNLGLRSCFDGIGVLIFAGFQKRASSTSYKERMRACSCRFAQGT